MTAPTVDEAFRVAAGCPGALHVCLELAQGRDADEVFRALRELGFRGPDIWVAYRDFAGCNLARLCAALLAGDPALVAAVEAAR